MGKGEFFSRKSTVFESPWLTLEALETDMDGSIGTAREPYYRLVDAPGVICVLLTALGEFVLVRQPRPAIESNTLEFPAGRVDSGETPEDAVRREVLEETGMHLRHLRPVANVQPIPNRLHSPQTLFVGVGSSDPPLSTTEANARPAIIPRDQLLTVLRAEGMHCVVALGAIKLAELLWSIDIFRDPIEMICRCLDSGAVESRTFARRGLS